jgi:nucleoid-associated protein YgaU
MAKPHSQTGHGPLGGTEDESSLAHGEASRGDAEGDEGHDGDWDVPSAHDNSPLSRILGLVLIVVLAGVFSFVAYRKYDEARRNPAIAQTTDPTDPTQPSSGAASEPSPFGGEEPGKTPSAAAGGPAHPNSADGFAHGSAGSSDAFQSSEPPARTHLENSIPRNGQQAAAPGRVSLGQTQPPGTSNSAVAHESDANPFGDLGGQPQQPLPKQSEPPQQFAGGPPAATSFIRPNPVAASAATVSSNPANVPGNGPPQATSVASADADMQNLFPDENKTPHDRGARNSQSPGPHDASLEPTGMTRTAEVNSQSQGQQNQFAQKQQPRTPPAQSEPADELLDESHPNGKPAVDPRGLAQIQPQPHSDGFGGPPPSVGHKGRAAALLANKEPGDDSSLEGSPVSGAAVQTPIRQRTPMGASPRPDASSFHASGAAGIQPGVGRSPAASDDPFASNRPAEGGALGARSGWSSTSKAPQSAPMRPATVGGGVSPLGTTADTGDYYVVQPQDNFWTISRKKYGTSRYFQALAEVNKSRIPEPSRMRPGMKVSTPPAELLEERYGQFMPPGTRVQVTAAEETAKIAPSGFIVGPDGTPKFITSEHDTLSSIAARHLGRSSRWIQIYEMNRDKLPNPNQVKVGTELVLPGDASNVAMSTEDDERR